MQKANALNISGNNALTLRTSRLVSTAIATILAATMGSVISPANAMGTTCPTTVVGAQSDGCEYSDDTNINIFSSGVVSVTEGVALEISTDYSSDLSNKGTISAEGSGTGLTGILLDSNLLTSGTITNGGEITVAQTESDNDNIYGIKVNDNVDGAISNLGQLNISATDNVSMGAYAYGILVNDDLNGSVANSGAININIEDTSWSGQAYGITVFGDTNGSITNKGEININAEADNSVLYIYGIYLGGDVNGNVITAADSEINITATNSQDNITAYGIRSAHDLNGTITNNGSINLDLADINSRIDAYAIGINGDVNGSVTNTGTLSISASNSDSGMGLHGVKVNNDVNGTITNNGHIIIDATNVNSDISAYGISIIGNLEGSVVNSGTISITENDSVFDNHDAYASAYGIYVNEDMNGSISNSGTINVDVSNSYFHSEESAATGFARVTAAGIWVDGDVNGNITNSGTINVNATNSLYYTDDSSGGGATAFAYAYGIFLNGDVNGNVTNNGTISINGTNSGSGLIAYGIYVSGDLNGVITNNGSINVTGEDDGGMLSLEGIYVDGGDLNGSIINNGSIVVTGSGANQTESRFFVLGITVDNDLNEGASIINNGTITISSSNFDNNTHIASAAGIWVGGDMYDGATIVNNGTINATEYVENTNNTDYIGGIYVRGDLSGENASIVNNGTIAAVIQNDLSDDVYLATAYGVYVGGDVTGNNASIVNNGTINISRDDLYGNSLTDTRVPRMEGLYVAGELSGDGANITNNGTITLITNSNDNELHLYGIYADSLGADSTVNNTGTIISLSSQYQDNAYSLFVAGGSGAMANSGTLVGNIHNGGTVTFENSGTIILPTNVNDAAHASVGSYTQSGDNARLWFGVESNAAHFGKMSISSTADFTENGKLGIILSSGTYTGAAMNNIISAGTLDGDTYTVADNSIKWNFIATKDGNTVDITSVDTGLTSLEASVAAVGGNGGGAARVLDSLLDEAYTNPDIFNAVSDIFGGVTSDQEAADAVSSTMPLLAAAGDQTVLGTGRAVGRIIQARIGSESGVSTGDAFGKDRNAWIKPFGSRADQDRNCGIAGYTANTAGVAMGADTMVNDATRVGVSFVYAHSDIDSDGAAVQNTKIDSYQGVVYGSYNILSNLDANFQVDMAKNENKGERTVGGSVASSNHDSWSTHFGAGLDQKYKVAGDATFVPSVRADYASINSGSYSETGAGLLNLNVDHNNQEELILGVDGKLLKPVNTLVSVTGNLGAGYDVLHDDSSITSGYVGGGAQFVTKGLKTSPWLGRGGLGVIVNNFEGAEITTRYDLEAREKFTDQTVSLKLRMPF